MGFHGLRIAALASMLIWTGGAATALSGEQAEVAAEAVRQVLTDQQAAWNRGDIDAFMEGYIRSEDLRFASGGTVLYGWQATIDRYHRTYVDNGAMGQLTFSELDVRMLSADSALVFGRWSLQRENDSPGGLFTLVFRKTQGGWRIVHDHTSSQ